MDCMLRGVTKSWTQLSNIHFPYPGDFPTQGWNSGLLHCRWILYQVSHKGSPRILEWVADPFSKRSSWPGNRTGVSCIAGGFFTNWIIREALESVMPSKLLILCHPFFLLPSIFASIRVFSNESSLCIRWPKYRSFSFSISPSNEYSGLISFSIDWFDLPAVQGTLKSLLQHHSSKASILRHSVFFIV